MKNISPMLSALILCLAGCSRESGTVHFVFTAGYRGAFIIYTSKADGITIDDSPETTHMCVIPPSGILHVKGKGPFYKWHGTTAAFDNGESIPMASQMRFVPDGVVAFWDGGSRPGRMLYDFIGTNEEAKRFRDQTAAGDVIVGGIKPDNGREAGKDK